MRPRPSRHCPTCGSDMDAQRRVCPKCGKWNTPQGQIKSEKRKLANMVPPDVVAAIREKWAEIERIDNVFFFRKNRKWELSKMFGLGIGTINDIVCHYGKYIL